MFRSKRSSHVKRLWKSRIAQHETESSDENNPEELEKKSVTQSILKRLKEKQLEMLIQSVESKGEEHSGCVLLPKGDLRLGRRCVAPHILCLQIWRWSDISGSSELRRMPFCETVDDDVYVCCNPYHWSRKSDELESPFLGRSALERVHITDFGQSEMVTDEVVSTETGNTPTPHQLNYSDDSMLSNNGCVRGPHWCTVAYWELRQRVGRLYMVYDPNVNIFQSLPHGDGLSLELLQKDAETESVKRTRDKIGIGVVLSREDDGVWLYNRSQFPVFVNSPTLENIHSRTLPVLKLLPGYSIKIFDYDSVRLLKQLTDKRYLDGPFDPASVRISFAKGWGPNYHRQFITSCPAWLEVLMTIDR
ncbi:SMAD6 [Mytilus coruscus]|uniref:Mothers against decapentaplegic homolog n=1 Tax=Mytilus coruscus TaxID=42192 RepID=A0A6J8ACZ0_MYTCO|nr:SMAD6 [Mytilus coruscus]